MDFKCAIAIKDSDELLGCLRTYPMPSADQSVFREVYFELSYQRKRGDIMMFSLHFSNNSMSGGDQTSIDKL